MKKSILTIIVVLISQLVFAQYDPDAKTLLDAMSAKYRKIPAFKAAFSQSIVNESADLNETMSGYISVKGAQYILQIAGQEIYNDGADVWSYNEELQEITVSTYEPEDQEISLNNIWDLYQKGFKYILLSANDQGNNVVDLDPVERDKSYFKIRMIIGQDYALKSFTVFEVGGNKYEYAINSFEELPALTDDAFTFDPAKYPDAEVIDFR
ncbi:MAG: outer membrane lipoprotein carrier protein [Cyclobacteriaceae bacterium]|jgi:outer membrane lipoprotein carrier protein